MNQQQYYCCIGQQQYGPLSLEQLKQWASQGQLQATDHVCLVGQQQWTVAGNVPNLFTAAQANNPYAATSFPPSSFSPQSYSQPSYAQPSYSQEVPAPADGGFTINTGAKSYGGTPAYSPSAYSGPRQSSRVTRDQEYYKWMGGAVVTVLVVLGFVARVARVALKGADLMDQRGVQQRQADQAQLREQERQRQWMADMQNRRPPEPPNRNGFDVNEFNRRNKQAMQPWQK